MDQNIAESVYERIRATINQLEVSASYRGLMLSVVNEALKRLNCNDSGRIATAFLPAVFTCAFGGNRNQSLAVTSAWFLLQLSAHLLDKVEDQEVDETMVNHDRPGLILNLSTGLIFAAEYLLDHLEVDGIDHQTASDIRSAFNKHIVGVCGGQHEDLHFDKPDLNLCWQIARVKSGLVFGLGCYAGARIMMTDPDCLSRVWSYGIHLGLIKQIADDIESFVEQKNPRSELAAGKWTLPVAYSLEILPEAMVAELKCILHKAMVDPISIGIAREKIVRSGALVYLKLETMKHAFEANKAIVSITLPNFNRKDLAVILAQTAGMEEHVLS